MGYTLGAHHICSCLKKSLLPVEAKQQEYLPKFEAIAETFKGIK